MALKNASHAWLHGATIGSADMDAGAALANLGSAAVLAANLGLAVINKTGGDLAAGILVSVSGWDATSGKPKIVAADQSSAGTLALWVLSAAIANNATGTVQKQYTLTGQNTNSASAVGDPVYLSTAGGWTLTAPTGGDRTAQFVGIVTVKSATVGQVDLDLTSAQVVTIGANQLVGNARTRSLHDKIGTIATTGAGEILFTAPCNGQLTLIELTGKDALSTDNTNFLTFALTNKSQAGAGSTAMVSQTAGAATTKTTGGQALVAYGKCDVPLHATFGNLTVVKGDTLAFTWTASGTLANTVTEAALGLDFTVTS